MKFLMFISLFIFSGVTSANILPCDETDTLCLPQNIEVSVFGVQMGPKQEDYDLVRNSIAELVMDLQVKKYVLMETGIEGGFRVCIESINGESYGKILNKLWPITGQVDDQQTLYEIKHTKTCK